MNKKVYLIIPVFNVEKYLNKCLDSVFIQTYKNIDVICVNDGSTDSSLIILEGYKKINPNMVIINKNNGGLSSARNTGLDYIHDIDSYVMFLDSDDWIHQTYIEKMVNTLEKENADIVCSDYYDVGSYDFSEVDNTQPLLKEYSNFTGVKALFDITMQSHGPCKLYKTKLWENIRYDETISFLEDQSTIFKTFLLADRIVHTTFKGYYYYHRLGSICQSKMTNKKILSALRSYNYVVNYDFGFNNEQNNELQRLSFSLFLQAYLMLYPRYSFKTQSDTEKEEMEVYFKAANNKVLCKQTILNKKNKVKYCIYRCSKSVYKYVYSKFLKIYDK